MGWGWGKRLEGEEGGGGEEEEGGMDIVGGGVGGRDGE